jgi:tetratricopeptide (TPR) repeat protein
MAVTSKTGRDNTVAARDVQRLIALSNARRYPELEVQARALLSAHPDSGFGWKVLGVALWMQGKPALQAFERASQLLPEDAEAQSNLASNLLKLGQFEAAVARCERALAINPGLAEAHNNLGNALKGMGRLDEAVASYGRALQIQPRMAPAHNNLGNALRALGRVDEAVASYGGALAINPQFAEAHNNLGNALRALGQSQEAAASCRRALAIRPQFAEGHNTLGNALLDMEQLQAAEASYRQALALAPDYAEALSNLGNVLRLRGRLGDALACCRRALQIKPDFAEAHNNIGNALRTLGQLHEAVASYERALQINPGYAEAHSNLGSALLDLWRLDAAAASYRRALQIRPDYAEAHGKLGNVLLHLWQLDEAEASCRRSLALQPEYAEAHHHLGNVLFGQGRADEAMASYRRALELKPDYAEVHVSLGTALRPQGRASEAEASARRALELEPELISAIALLAELQVDNGQFAQAEELTRLAISKDPQLPASLAGIPRLRKMTEHDGEWLAEALRLAQRGLPPRQEINLRYAMGKYFDDLRDFEQAYEHFRLANELTKRHRPPHDRQQVTRSVDRIMRVFDGPWLSRKRAYQDSSSRPVFIVGMTRSGTTLAEQILASHPSVFGAGEQSFWTLGLDRYLGAPDADAEAAVVELSHEYLRLLQDLSTNALRVVDKMPANYLALGLIQATLPNAHIIHMRRNPIDTCLSIYFQDFNTAHTYANDLEDLAHEYRQYARLMDHWRALLPRAALLEVPYEGLVSDQEGWTRRMLQFIGLPWDPRCLEFQHTGRAVLTASRWQVRQKIHGGSVQRWRNYEQYMGPLLGLLELAGAP